MIIEDDKDDQELLEETFSALQYPSPLIFFSNGNDALRYLHETSTPPILIISDINMPKINGLEIQNRINKSPQLRKLEIPFVFLTTGSKKATVPDSLLVPDPVFFTKPSSMEGLRNTIRTIVEYWVHARGPVPCNKQY